MPRGLTADQQTFAIAVFSQLVREAEERGESKPQERIGRKVGLSQSGVSRAAKHGAISMQALLAGARLARRSPEEIRRVLGIDVALDAALKDATQRPWAVDPPAYTFLADATRLPKFQAWLRSHQDVSTSKAATIIESFFTTPPKCDGDGVPQDGWDHFASDVLSGVIDQPASGRRVPEDIERAELAALPRPKRRRRK